MGATVLNHDGDDPRQREAVQIKQVTRSRRGGAPAGPDVIGVAKPPGRGGVREERELGKVVYPRDKQGEQRRWEEVTKRTGLT